MNRVGGIPHRIRGRVYTRAHEPSSALVYTSTPEPSPLGDTAVDDAFLPCWRVAPAQHMIDRGALGRGRSGGRIMPLALAGPVGRAAVRKVRHGRKTQTVPVAWPSIRRALPSCAGQRQSAARPSRRLGVALAPACPCVSLASHPGRQARMQLALRTDCRVERRRAELTSLAAAAARGGAAPAPPQRKCYCRTYCRM